MQSQWKVSEREINRKGDGERGRRKEREKRRERDREREERSDYLFECYV